MPSLWLDGMTQGGRVQGGRDQGGKTYEPEERT
jgi:hypothetical protein